MEIPYDRLPPETLRAVIEEYVSREGTDYGEHVYSLDQKVEHVLAQLKSRKVAVVWNAEQESCDIVPRDQLPRE